MRLEVFWGQLEAYSIERVIIAFERAFEELKWFPVPADIIEFLSEKKFDYPKPDLPEIDHRLSPEETRRVLAGVEEHLRNTIPGWDKTPTPADGIKSIFKRAKDTPTTLEGERADNFEARRQALRLQGKLILDHEGEA